MTKIFALEEEYKLDRRVRLKLDKIEKIFKYPIPQDQIAIKAFPKTIQFIQY